MTKEKIFAISTIILSTVAAWALLTRSPENREKINQVVPEAYDADKEEYAWEKSEFAIGLEVPWDMALLPDGGMLITERPGRLKIRLADGQLKTVAEISSVVSIGESGLTGLALDPDFASNHLIYLYYTARKNGSVINRVSRFEFDGEKINNEKIILDDLPGGSIHNGGRLRFGPDKKLYVPTGDGARPTLAQDANSLGGKILRINSDGSIPEDNPQPNSKIYTLGHRNPQGLAWHPLTEELISTEHGESAHDEINLISPSKNYGWPNIKKCQSDDQKFTPPLICSGNETYAPSGVAFLGTEIWRFRYSFVFAGLRGNRLERVDLVDGKVSQREVIIKGDYGRLRGVITDTKGNIYVSTSNKDGRGNPVANDDKIIKLTPVLK